MSDLIFVTGNESKFREAAAILGPFGVRLTQRDLPLVEPQADDPRDVLAAKAKQARHRLSQPFLVDDTALTLAGYPGFPGAYTAAMARVLAADGLRRLLDPGHRATFTALVGHYDGRRLRVFRGTWHGRMEVPERLGEGAWPYNALFVPDGFDRPLSEISWEVRLRHSHRRRALEKLARFLTRAHPEPP